VLVIALTVVLTLAGVLALVVRRRRPTPTPASPETVESQPKPRAAVLAAAVPAPATISGEVERPRATPPVRPDDDALDALDALLAELESTTVRIDGADALDEGSVRALEGLAERLEEAAAAIASR
jgi:hypothetical protein